MKKSKIRHFDIWSNLFFLLPFFTAIYLKIYVIALWAGAVILVSTAYHLSNEKFYIVADVGLAWTGLVSTILLVYLGAFTWPYFHLAILLVVIAIFFRNRGLKRGYDLNHSLWHFFSSLITVFALLDFVF